MTKRVIKKNTVLQSFLCPHCKQGIHLEAQDFTVTIEADQTWSADPAIVCPYEECGVEYFITRGNVHYVDLGGEVY